MSEDYSSKKPILISKTGRRFKDFTMDMITFWTGLITRLDNDYDHLGFVTGGTGSGKSTFVGNVCFDFAGKEGKKIGKDKFEKDLEGNKKRRLMFTDDNYTSEEEKFASMIVQRSGEVIWFDEAREGVNRQNWFADVNKLIKKRKNTNRKLNNIYFLCLPIAKEIDEKLGCHATFWVSCKRGVAEIFCPREEERGGSVSWIHKILEREDKIRKEYPEVEYIPPYVHQEFIGRIFFKKLTRENRKRYNKLVAEHSSYGKLTNEEIKKMKEISKMDESEYMISLVNKMRNGELKSKFEVFKEMPKDWKPKDKISKIDFYLDLMDLPKIKDFFKEENIKFQNLITEVKT